jgi:hypothetical protein
MKTSRLLIYAGIGIIAGLLLENKSIKLRNNVSSTARDLRDKVNKTGRKAKAKMSF